MGCGFVDATKFNLMKIGMQLREKGRSSRKFRSAFSSDLTPIVHETIIRITRRDMTEANFQEARSSAFSEQAEMFQERGEKLC